MFQIIPPPLLDMTLHVNVLLQCHLRGSQISLSGGAKTHFKIASPFADTVTAFILEGWGGHEALVAR